MYQCICSFGGELTSSRVFCFLAFMYLYFLLFIQLSSAVIGLGELLISLRRVQQILLRSPIRSMSESDSDSQYPISAYQLSGRLLNAQSDPDFLIRDVSFKLRKGETMSIIGRVRSGKSSLLMCFINEIDILQGECHLTGSCAFVPQEPWIQSTSVRDNIQAYTSLNSRNICK